MGIDFFLEELIKVFETVETKDFFSKKFSLYWCLASMIVLSDITRLLSSQAFGIRENVSVIYKDEVLVPGLEISLRFVSIVKCSVSCLKFLYFEIFSVFIIDFFMFSFVLE